MYDNNLVPKIVIGCDPSYSHFGLSVLDRCSKEIKTYDIETKLGSQDFYNICMKSKEQVDNVISVLKEHPYNILDSSDCIIGMENALPFAFNSVSLTALDVMLFHNLGSNKTALFNPTYLNYIMGKHTKRDSINLANALLSIFEKHGYQHVLKHGKKLTDGEAESFIYVCRMYCRALPDDEITKDILSLQSLFADVKERVGSDFIY